MSKFRCRCGHVIVDQAEFLPHKADVLSDQDSERFWDDTAASVAAFSALGSAEERDRWIRAYFNELYPLDIPDASVIYDILTAGMLRYRRTLYECEACGRLWLQLRPDENRWVSYSPDEPGATGVLRSAAETSATADDEQ